MTHTRIILTLCLCLALVRALAMPVAAAEPVVVMAAGAAPLTKDQVAQIYLGRSNTLKPLDLPDSNPLRDEFYRRATDRDAAQIRSVWSRIIFTGQGQPPKEVADAAAVKRAVAGDAKMIGYIDKSDLDATVKVVLALH